MTADTGRFGSDSGALRSEDAPLITGRGRFTDDIRINGQIHAVFLRAPVGHAVLKDVDAQAARAMPGVLAVLTGADAQADGLGAIPPLAPATGRDGRPLFPAAMPVFATDRIRYAGEPLAIVVAESALQALDAAEAIELDYEPLAAAPDIESALAPDAEPVWREAAGNVALDWADGDEGAVETAFGHAAHVERVRLFDQRLAPTSLETRAGVGMWDENSGRYTLIASTQGVGVVRKLLAEQVFKVPPEQIRVLTYDVGGGFGMKAQCYPEYAALLYAARKTGRPVRWAATRLESFLSDSHGRDSILEGDMAFDADGRILGLKVRNLVGMGAYATQYTAIFTTANTRNCLSSVYAIPVIRTEVKVVLTNAAPLGPYRGAGRPEAIYLIERLLDLAAPKLGMDRAALRRRNLIRSAAMPYATAAGPVYDSGDFDGVMDRALKLADWDGFAARRAESERRGRLRGIGICCFLEVAGGILNETADLRFEGDNTVALRLGVQAMGQGHLSTLPRLIARRLGVKPEQVRLIEGDSDEIPDANGTPSVASRSIMMAGSAGAVACDQAIEKGRALAAHHFEAAPGDIEFSHGRFAVAGTDRSIPILELAQLAGAMPDLPEDLAGGLDQMATFVSPQMSFPNGCHVCEVEIDPETGAVDIVGYAAVDDVGTVLHEAIVDGQIHGGIAQGLGQVLGEQVVYDGEGQLLTASFMDYVMPRADDLPDLAVGHHPVPCATNPLGVKGAGESGVAGALPAGMSAVLDALASHGVNYLDLPASPQRVWRALQGRQTGD